MMPYSISLVSVRVGVAVETDEVGKVVDAGDVAIGRQRLNRVFIAVMS